MNRKSIILSIEGLRLSKGEYSLIQNENLGALYFSKEILKILTN
jgi:hypothetical protein